MKKVKSTYTIKEIKKIAAGKGGDCLSEKYINYTTKLKWKCTKGHIWEAAPSKIIFGTWCPHCIPNKKGNIDEMYRIANERKGVCLSNEYINSKTNLLWRCEKGHTWQATPNNIKRGKWCPYCAGTIKDTIENMYQIAKQKDGKCLAEKYINSQTKLKWECKEGHKWEAIPNTIKQGQWCPKCAGKQLGTIVDMNLFARQKGGKCLSNEYKNAHTKLKWQCAIGHIWEATPGNIKYGNWCPKCGDLKKGQYKKLSIKDMQNYAQLKNGKCLSRAYINSLTKLQWQCEEGHQWYTTPSKIIQGKWCPYCAGNAPDTIENMQEIAKEKGGKCLSSEYISTHVHLIWQCDKGHVWKSSPSNIKNGSWCPYCAGTIITIDDMRSLAKERGGECLSNKYINSTEKLKWKCSVSHIWKTSYASISNGSWCPPLCQRSCRLG